MRTDTGAPRPQDLRQRLASLDDVDRAIVRVLSTDARTPNNALAAQVGVAASTALTRVRSLRERGVIRGFHADVDPAALGHDLQAMIAVQLRADARPRMSEFVDRLRRREQVLDVYFVAGDDDYLVHVATADTHGLRELVAGLSADPAVSHTRTSLIFEHVRAAGHLG